MKKIILIILISAISAASFAQIADSAKRHVILQGAANFRDIGGYETKDGHYVKWNEIYRSADISKLTDSDLVVLKQRNITYDVDLRGLKEQAKAPDKINPGTDYILCPVSTDDVDWISIISKLKGNQGDSLITAFYADDRYLADKFKPFFDKLLVLPAGQSLVYHCTAGKDRTGIATALLLYALGVPYDTIVKDYVATNYYRQDANVVMETQIVTYMHADPQVAKDMMSAKKEYLDTSFNTLIKQYGSIDNYLRLKIGLDDNKIAILKKKFLD